MSVPMCADVETMCSFRNAHRPISVPLLQDIRPSEKLTSADIGAEVAVCLAKSPLSRSHIGRHRHRCVPAGWLYRNTHRPTSAPICTSWLALQKYTSADIGTDVAGYLVPRAADIGLYRYRCVVAGSAASGLPHRPMSVPMCVSWIDFSRNSTSADVGADVHQQDGPPRTATSADIGTDVCQLGTFS